MMKRTLAVASVLAAFAFAAATPAQAQMKVGVVDMNKVFSEYYKTKDAETRINEARAAAKKEMDDRMEARQKLLDSGARDRCIRIGRGLEALLRKEQGG